MLPLTPPHARFESLENPFSPLKKRNPDDVEHVEHWLDPKETAAMRKLMAKKQPPPEPQEDWSGSEGFELSPEEKQRIEEEKIFGEIIARQSIALRERYGREIPIPPLPEGITPELLKFWEANLFKLEYVPRIDMTEDQEFPLWKHKPGKRHTPGQQYGIEFYDEVQRIQDLQENKNNPNLQGLKPTELPGAWVLRDTRAKPNYKDGKQAYEDDALIQGVLQQLAKDGILNPEAAQGLRNKIHPSVFDKREFWEAFRKALKVNQIPGSIVRNERVIEKNVHGQGKGFHDTSTYEWCEEYYQSGKRVISGDSDYGGASDVGWFASAVGYVGFRPLVVFPHK